MRLSKGLPIKIEMSIRIKIFIIIVSLFALLGGVDFLIQRQIIYPSFLELEYHEAGENIRRIFSSIDREIEHLNQFCGDWAVWDDAYSFMENQNKDFIAANLDHEILGSNELDLLVFCRPDGKITWKGQRLNADQSFMFLLHEQIAPTHPLLQLQERRGQGKGASGIFMTQFGPLLFSSQEILHSDGSGPASGTLIFGRLLTDSMVKKLREQTRIDFVIHAVAEKKKVCAGEERKGKESDLLYFTQQQGQYVNTCAPYLGMAQQALFSVQYMFPREVTRKGLESMRYAALLIVFSAVLIVCILHLLLQYVVIRPLQRLTDHMIHLQEEEDYSLRIEENRQDEVGVLARSFNTMVATIAQRTQELKSANEQLIMMSMQDGLTGIANRRMFDMNLQKEWRRAMREQTPLSLIMLDVDFFKRYNDAYGHQQGDECLIRVAEALQQHIRRPADLVARYGGEEFVMVLPGTHAEGALLVAERARMAVEQQGLEHRESTAASVVTISLGVATIVPAVDPACTGVEKFIQTADQALYQAKAQGRNQVVSHSDIPVH